jgi:hypothetical protein
VVVGGRSANSSFATCDSKHLEMKLVHGKAHLELIVLLRQLVIAIIILSIVHRDLKSGRLMKEFLDEM